MKKGTFLIFAAVILLAQKSSETHALQTCGSSPSCTAKSIGVSKNPYTYCTLGDQFVDCNVEGAQQQQGTCYTCPAQGDPCMYENYYYSMYDSNGSAIDRGGCIGETVDCPPIPCQNIKKNEKRKK